jgi:protein involved in polysaccharide export with SLBB domain
MFLLSFRRGLPLPRACSWLLLTALLLPLAWSACPANAQTANQEASASESSAPAPLTTPSGPVRLNKPPTPDTAPVQAVAPAAPAAPLVGEFEQFVQRQAGSLSLPVTRLGSDLMTGGFEGGADLTPLVPADYVVAPGDEVLVTFWGAVEADLRLRVDRGGRIAIPRVGTVQVAGVRHADLQGVIERRAAQIFKNFQVSVSLGQLRGIRVFVTGFVTRPGAYTVSSLSTAVSALMRAGGPASAGSFRGIEVRRGGQLLSTFDLYDLLTRGDRSADRILQGGDVVHVRQVGNEVGVIGSVNKPAIIELREGETVGDALRYAGGFTAVADRSRLIVERLADRRSTRVAQLDLPAGLTQTLSHGDVLRAVSAVDIALSNQRPNKRVRIEGEVQRPGEYVLPERSTIGDALRAAGGLTPSAYLYATEFSRESVRVEQQVNYDRALRDLETDFARSSSAQRVSSGDEATAVAARNAVTARLIDRLRAIKPNGRIVLQIPPDTKELPDLALEDGDRLFVPAVPSTVGVYGSVFNAASYLYSPDRNYGAYLRLAGGMTKGADEGSVFVVRANGAVVSARQSTSFFNSSGEIAQLKAAPGDTIFVPEETLKTTFVQSAKDWTQILYQFGLGLAGLRTLR